MCARPCVCPQNRNDMAVSEAAPVSGVRVMGWRRRGSGRGVTEGGAAGSAAVRSGINFVAFEERVTVWCCGQDWCDSRYDMRVTGTTGRTKGFRRAWGQFSARLRGGRRQASIVRKGNCPGRIHSARKGWNRAPAGPRPCGTNWRDNVNFIRDVGYRED